METITYCSGCQCKCCLWVADLDIWERLGGCCKGEICCKGLQDHLVLVLFYLYSALSRTSVTMISKEFWCLPLCQRPSRQISIPLGYSILFQMQLFCPGLSSPPHNLLPTFKTCLELPGHFCSSSCCEGHRALLLPEIMSVNLKNNDHIIYYFLVSICVLVNFVRIFFI